MAQEARIELVPCDSIGGRGNVDRTTGKWICGIGSQRHVLPRRNKRLVGEEGGDHTEEHSRFAGVGCKMRLPVFHK